MTGQIIRCSMVLFFVSMLPVVGGADAETFELQCSKLPFPVQAESRPIDQRCGLTGDQTDGPKAVQNSLKNNLCLSGVPLTLQQDDFVSLQRTVKERGIKFGHSGFVQEPAPKPPNPDAPERDEKLAERDVALCHSVTAEIIPHFRPTQWEQDELRRVAGRELPVRIAGQLFFDASHFPCDGENPHGGESLRRASLWEIHPVYSIDVCKSTTLDDCRADDGVAPGFHSISGSCNIEGTGRAKEYWRERREAKLGSIPGRIVWVPTMTSADAN